MESIDLTDFGPPYTNVIVSELLSTSDCPGECSADNEVAADNDASSFLPLLDEVLERRANALSRDPPEPPRLSTPVNLGQDARPKRCRSIYGLYLEGDEEISLEYLGPNFRGGYDSESGSVEPADDPQEKESQAERSIYLDGEEVCVQTRQLEHGPQNDQTTETNPSPENVEISSSPSTAVRNEDSSDGTPSHVLHASLVAGARAHIAGQEKCAGACSAEAISSATRTTAHSFVPEENGQDNAPRVRSAIASSLPKARNTSAEATGAKKPNVSAYKLKYKVVSADGLEAASAAENKSRDDETRNSKLGNEKFIDGSPTHARESVLMAGCRAYYDGEEYRAARSHEALFPPSAKAFRRSAGALDNENSHLDGVCFPGDPSPEVRDSSPEPSRSFFDGERITIASSPDVRDSSPELPREADLNFSAYELENEQLDENATECIQILDNKPEEGEALNIVVAAEDCRQASLSRTAEPLIIARDHKEEGHTGTYSSETIFPAPVSDSHCSVECTGDSDDADGAGSAGTSLLGVRYGYAERFHEIDSKTSQLEFEPNIEKVSQDTSATEHGFRDSEAPNAAIGYEDHNQSLSQKSPHIQAAQSHNDGEEKYRDECSTVTVSPAPARSRDCAAKSLESEVEHYHGTGYVGDSLPGTHDNRTEFSRRADSNCAANQAEYDPKIEDVLVTEDASQNYDTLSPAIQPVSSPKDSPESLPVSWAGIGADASEGRVSHDTMPAMVDDTESSEAKSICENILTAVLAFLVPTVRDICSEIFREVDSMSSAAETAYNQENKEKDEVLIVEDTSPDKDTPSTVRPTQSVSSSKCNPESLFVACTQARRDVSEDGVSHDTMAITISDTEFSDAKTAHQNDLSSALLSSLSGACDTCTQMFHQVDSHSSADEYDPRIKEADDVVIVTEDTSQNDDTLSTVIRNQSVLPPQLNPESLLVACTQVQRDVSEDYVSHDTMMDTPNDAEFSGPKSTRGNDLPSALHSVSGVDSNFSAGQGIEEASKVLVTEDTSQNNDTLYSAVRNQDIQSPEHNMESLFAYTRTPLDVSEDDASHDTTPFMANDTDSCEANSTLENNLSSAIPSSLTAVCYSDIEHFKGVNSNYSANLAEYDPHIKEADEVVLITEDNSQDIDTLSTAIRNLNVSSPKHKTEPLLVALTQAQRGVSEDDIARKTMPVTVGDTESSALKTTSENNLRSDLSCPEDLRDAPKLYHEDLFKTVISESLSHQIALQATPQNSKSELSPAASSPEPVKQLAMGILKCINVMSFLPIYDYCPPSGSGSVTSRPSSPSSLALRSEGEICSRNESENILPLSVLPKAAVSEGESVGPEYDPEAFLPLSSITASTMSEGETADSVSDESTTSPFLSSELNEAEKFGSEDTSTVSESTSTETEDESTTSSSSSSSTRSYSSSPSTQSASDSKDSTESSLSSSPLSVPQRHEILEAQIVKEADVSQKETVGTEVTTAAVHSEPCYTQPASSGTDRLDHQDNKENVISTSLASVSALKEDKKDGLEYDTDIMIPLMLPISPTTPCSVHSEPCYTLPTSSGIDLPDRQHNRENGFPAFLASVPARKEDKKGFEKDDDMLIPFSLPISLTMPSKKDAVESDHDLTVLPSTAHFAQSDISGDKNVNSKYVSSTLPRLLPCPERLSDDGKAVKVQDERPPAPKKKKTKRNQKRQRKHPLQKDLRRCSMKTTTDIIERVPPETYGPLRPNKRPPLISDDPAENWDNENPQWESMRGLSSEEERYRAVIRVWHSKRIPDPQKDLTTFHHRRRLLGFERCGLPSTRRHRKRRASRGSGSQSDDAKRQRLDTDIFDKKFEDVEKSREREMAEAEDKLNRSLLEVRKYKRSERRRRSPGDESSSSPRRPWRYRRQCSEDRSNPSPNRRSRRRHSSSEIDSDSSLRRHRGRSRGYSEDASDHYPRRRRRGHSQPSRGMSDSPSMRRRTQRHYSSEYRSVSSSSECRSEGSRKKVRHHRSQRLRNFSPSFRSARSCRRGCRHTSEDDSDSSPRRRKRGRRDSFGSTSDSSPRRRIRERRWSSESGDDDFCTRSRGRRPRRLSQSDNDRSARKRSRDMMKSMNSPYWRRRERRIREDFEADRQGISSKYYTKLDKLVAAREEVSRVNSFYSGLRNTDPRMLSARQVKDHWKLELMLREMEKRYEPAQD